MLKIGDYIYFFTIGIAKIVEITDDQVTAIFKKNKKCFNINSQSYKIVSLDIINSLKDKSWKDYFTKTTLVKAQDYYNDGNVESISIEDNRIYSEVRGNSLYKTDLFISKKISLFECSCPVGFNCKHAAATLYSLENEYNVIEKSYLKSNSIINKSNPMINNINSDMDTSKIDELILRSNQYFSINQIKEFKQLIEKYDQNEINKLIAYLIESKHEKNKIRNALIIIYCLYSYSSDYVTMCFSKSSYYYEDAIAFKKSKKNDFRRNYFYSINDYHYFSLIYFYLNNDQTKILETLLNNNNELFIDEFLSEVTELSSEQINQIAYYLYQSENVSILKFKCIKNKMDLLINCINRIAYRVPINIIKEFPFEYQYDLLYNTDIKNAYNYVITNDELKNYDNKKYVSVLTYYFANCNSKQKKLIITKLLTIKDTDYIISFLEDEFNYEDIDYSLFDKFFDIEYKIKRNEYKCDENYLLRCYKCKLYEIDNDKVSSHYLINSHEHFKEIFRKIIDYKYANEISLLKETINKEIQLKLEQKNDDELTYLLNDLKRDIIPLANMYKQSIQASLECYFSIISSYNGNYITLSFKIGQNKKYVVKNVTEFIEYFGNNTYITYGKEFSFYHNIDNLEKPYNDLINLLMKLNLSVTSDRRNLRLSLYLFTDILNILKGSKIFFNDKEYIVRLDDYNYKISIDKNYNLKTNYDKNLIIESAKGLYIFDKTKGIIDAISADNTLKKLVLFANEASGKSIKRLKQRFTDEIYSRFYQYIDIDDSIKTEFVLSEITINAYFDIVDKAIVVKTKINKYEKEIEASELKQNQDIYKYQIYLNYLSKMGFVEDKIIEEEYIYRFYTMDFSELKKICNVFFSESISSKSVITFTTQTCRIDYNNGLLDVFFEDSIYTEDELKKIYDAIRLKKKYIMLKKDTIIDINNEEALNFEGIVDDLALDKNHLLTTTQKPIYQVLKAYANTNEFRIDDYLLNMIDELANFKNYQQKLPNVNATLRQYQIEGFNWLSILTKYHMGGILADDMGLGKTLQIITLLKSDNNMKPSLVVCPKTLLFNWINEFEKFDPDTKVIPIYGNSNLRTSTIEAIDYNKKVIYISGYESLRNDIELYKGNFNFFILDEAQTIKNIYAGKSQAVKQIKAEHKFALTGTPIENNIIDLWSIFDFIMPGYFEELSQFKHRYNVDERFVGMVSKRISPFILRRCKKDVLNDLPDKIERIISVEMSEAQRKIYDAYRNQAVNILKSGGTSFDVLQILTRLRQICVDPAMFVDNFIGYGTKILELMNIVVKYIEEGHKIIVFSQFVKALNIIEKLFIDNKIKYLFLSGETKIEERVQLVDKFNNTDEHKVFLISLKAGGTGLNLVGADVVIHLDSWWNQAVENQATDRAYRIGQKRNVEVIKILCDDSIEQRVIELQNLKKDIIDKLISNDDSSISRITRDDLGFILNC